MKTELKDIKPGVNYPSIVAIEEEFEGEQKTIMFHLNSFYCGMYCAIHLPGDPMPIQTGDHDNKKFVRQLKKDIQKAMDRGAKVEIGSLLPIKTQP